MLLSFFLFLQPSEEEEIVDLMLIKFCNMFGLKCQKKVVA